MSGKSTLAQECVYREAREPVAGANRSSGQVEWARELPRPRLLAQAGRFSAVTRSQADRMGA